MISSNEVIEGLAIVVILAFIFGWLELWQTGLLILILVLVILSINRKHLRN